MNIVNQWLTIRANVTSADDWGVIRVQWRLGQFLREHNITAYRLAKESGLTRQGVSRIVNNQVGGLDFGTLERILDALERLTGKRLEVGDVLGVTRDE